MCNSFPLAKERRIFKYALELCILVAEIHSKLFISQHWSMRELMREILWIYPTPGIQRLNSLNLAILQASMPSMKAQWRMERLHPVQPLFPWPPVLSIVKLSPSWSQLLKSTLSSLVIPGYILRDPIISLNSGTLHWCTYCHANCLTWPHLSLRSTSLGSPESHAQITIPSVFYKELSHVFSKTEAWGSPLTETDCAIDLLPGLQPSKGGVSPLSHEEQRATEEYVSSGFWPCIGYRCLNSVRSAYNLVRIRAGVGWKIKLYHRSVSFPGYIMWWGAKRVPVLGVFIYLLLYKYYIYYIIYLYVIIYFLYIIYNILRLCPPST